MTTFSEYLEAQAEIMRLRAFGLATEAEEDRFADRLERLWWKLSVEERARVEEFFAEPEMKVPDTVRDVVDLTVPERSSAFPRRRQAAA